VSQAGLLRVAQEGERLRAECARRAAEREALVGALRHACLDLGEDAAAAAAEVHPALARGWCALQT
jgi:protein regulator of cytokinesis 1